MIIANKVVGHSPILCHPKYENMNIKTSNKTIELYNFSVDILQKKKE